MEQKELQLKTVSSLTKVFPQRIAGNVQKSLTGFCGTEVSFQVAFKVTPRKYVMFDYEIKIDSPLKDYISLFRVGLVPSALPFYPDRFDSNYLCNTASMFPDPLFPIKDGTISAASDVWKSLWVSLKLPDNCESGQYPVSISFYRNGERKAKTTFKINIRSEKLPENNFIYTQWFHCDCIADIHKVPVFSEAHWELIEKYMKLAAEHGMNMILTPVVTPPLDTAIGTERPTVQLVSVSKNKSGYTFDFTLLRRFINIAKKYGINNFEISHFFTQWGAKFAPKIVANVNGKNKKIFGWKTAATSPEYAEFLNALVPKLIDFFESENIERNSLYFHVSDEPHEDQLDTYCAAEEILRPLIKGCKHIDALSAFDFYKMELVSTPVVATNRITPFLDAKVDGLWCYYCCSQGLNVSNRFFAMPSYRTRAIGVQMYKYGIAGFLHWGYNFYYSKLSTRLLDPYKETDGGEAFPSGDTFTVYPYEDGAIPSLRQKVFADALNDIKLLHLLEAKIGKEKVVEELDKLMGKPLTFDTCPTSPIFFDKLYEMIFSYLD